MVEFLLFVIVAILLGVFFPALLQWLAFALLVAAVAVFGIPDSVPQTAAVIGALLLGLGALYLPPLLLQKWHTGRPATEANHPARTAGAASTLGAVLYGVIGFFALMAFVVYVGSQVAG